MSKRMRMRSIMKTELLRERFVILYWNHLKNLMGRNQMTMMMKLLLIHQMMEMRHLTLEI